MSIDILLSAHSCTRALARHNVFCAACTAHCAVRTAHCAGCAAHCGPRFGCLIRELCHISGTLGPGTPHYLSCWTQDNKNHQRTPASTPSSVLNNRQSTPINKYSCHTPRRKQFVCTIYKPRYCVLPFCVMCGTAFYKINLWDCVMHRAGAPRAPVF
jgi:hypothetical protein